MRRHRRPFGGNVPPQGKGAHVENPHEPEYPFDPAHQRRGTVAQFIEFIRKQGVVGLAIGFILGGSVSKVVTALVEDIINPIIGLLMGNAAGLTSAVLEIGTAKVKWGHLISTVIDFAIVAAVVYFGFKKLGLDKLDKKA